MSIKKDILAYIAGYIDGDGCFNIRKEPCTTYNKYPSQLIITSTNIDVLKYIQKYLGGSVTTSNNRIRNPKEKILYRFCLCGKKSSNIAEMLLPFLKERKEQCLCYISFVRESCKTRKDDLIKIMKYLKKFHRIASKENIIFLKSIKKTKSLEEIDYPYIAGFIDAECSLSVFRHKTKNRQNFLYKLVLSLSNTKLPCFIFLMERLGGGITFVPVKGKCNPRLIWRVSSQTLYELLPKINPFLRTKKPICEELIKFRNLILPNGGARHTESFRDSYQTNLIERDKIFHSVRQLNLKGFTSI